MTPPQLVKHGWKKGQSANPGGRPKSVGLRDWQIARQHTAEAIDKIVEFMRGRVRGFEEKRGKNGKVEYDKAGKAKLVPIEYVAPPTLQLQAAGMLIERGWGKAPQAILVAAEDGGEEDGSAAKEVEALEFIRSRLAGIAARLDPGEDTGVVIEAEPDR